MEKRIFGIETEFGCMVRDERAGTSERVVEEVKNHCFYQKKWGVIDLHARDYSFEPARSGGFLLNGGRLYIDAVGDHEEYATPECTSVFDACRYYKAGQWLVQSLLADLGLEDWVSFHNNSVDHFGGHTFGCHENYLVEMQDEDFFRASFNYLLPFLVTRQIFAGVGRVGGHKLNFQSMRNSVMTISEYDVDYQWVSNFYGVEIDPSVDFQLSQRADHIVKTISSRVRFNRAIINPKWDSYYNFSNLHRLHILYGEGNMSDYATALKIGTTSCVLSLVEDGLLGTEVEIRDPLETLKSVSRDPTWRWLVKRKSGGTIPAVDLQRIYLEASKKRLAGVDAETDWVLAEWEDTLNALEKDPMSLYNKLDWVAKRKIYSEFIEAEGVGWHDEVMQSLDIEYHNTNRATSLFYGLEEAGEMEKLVTDAEVVEAAIRAPQNTRAAGRAEIIKRLIDSKSRDYVIDWDLVYLAKNKHLDLKDPFHNYLKDSEPFVKSIS
jgi:proteasome accessory factor A